MSSSFFGKFSRYLFAVFITILSVILGYDNLLLQSFYVLISFILLVVYFKRQPIGLSLMFYVLILAVTGLVAQLMIEAGGYLFETDVFGSVNGSSLRLLCFYLIFFAVYLRSLGSNVSDQSNHLELNPKSTWIPAFMSDSRQVVLVLLFGLVVVFFGLLAGIREGFALTEGYNRYYIRSQTDGFGSLIFDFYLNNRIFLAFTLGALCYSLNWVVKVVALTLLSMVVLLSVAHGEQFMATVQLGVAAIVPWIIIQNKNKGVNYKLIGLMMVSFSFIGLISVIFAYLSQGYDIESTIFNRLALQSQLWYMVDTSANLIGSDFGINYQSFARFFASLLNFDFERFTGNSAEATGVPELMLIYGTSDIIGQLYNYGVTFTMGQMAIPVFWFGYLGGGVFVAVSAFYCARVGMLIVNVIEKGSWIELWLAAKIHSNLMFGLQQGEYWYLIGFRTVLFLLILWFLFRRRINAMQS